MRSAGLFLLLFLTANSGSAGPAIAYFTNARAVHITDPGRQNFFVVDAEIWAHARPDLGDLRLYDGDSLVQYAISEQPGGVSAEQTEAKILNLGLVAGHTEFDIDAAGLPEYDRIYLRLDAHDFVATAGVSGGDDPGKAGRVSLPPSTLYDFSKEQLGSSSVLKIPPSSFRYLHVRLSGSIPPDQVKGATISNLREQKAVWSKAGACTAPQQKERKTVISCNIPANVPLSRIAFQIAPAQVNFRRFVSVENANGIQLGGGEISRVRMNRGGTLVTAEELAITLYGNDGALTLVIDNGENPPLAVTAVEPLALERRIYFDAEGKTALQLYYGDEKLTAPAYDYARFFHLEPSAVEAQLGLGMHNARYAGRPDERPWSEQHKGILWAAMLIAVVALAALALRGLRTASTP